MTIKYLYKKSVKAIKREFEFIHTGFVFEIGYNEINILYLDTTVACVKLITPYMPPVFENKLSETDLFITLPYDDIMDCAVAIFKIQNRRNNK